MDTLEKIKKSQKLQYPHMIWQPWKAGNNCLISLCYIGQFNQKN